MKTLQTKIKLFVSLLVVLGILLGTVPVHANQTIEFEPVELPITEITKGSIYVHPSNDQIVFLTITGRGIFRSINGADSWERYHIPGFDTTNAVAMAFADSNPSKIYVATETELLVTHDSGGSWNKVLGYEQLHGERFRNVQIHPTDQNFAVMSSTHYLYYTYNSWETVQHKYFQDTIPYKGAVGFDTQDKNTFYLPLSSRGYAYTNDRGGTWQTVIPAAGAGYVAGIYVDPNNSNCLYLSYGYLWKSLDKGRTWQRLEKNGGGSYIFGTVVFDRQNSQPGLHGFNRSQHYYLAPGEEIIKNQAGLPFYSQSVDQVLAVSYQNHQKQYLVAETGIYKTEDLGETWLQKNDGLEGFNSRSLQINQLGDFLFPTTTDRLYKASGDWSDAQELNWVPNLPNFYRTRTIWLDPRYPNRQYTYAWYNDPDTNLLTQALFYSDDNWANSESIKVLSNDTHFALRMAFDAAQDGPAYIYMQKTETYVPKEYLGIYKSGNPGEDWTWIDLNNGYPYGTIAMVADPYQPNTLYVVTVNQEVQQLATLRVNTHTGQYIKIGGEGSVFQTKRIAHITPDPLKDGRIYIGVFPTLDWDGKQSDQIVNYRSDDHGETWTPINLPGRILISPQNEDLLIGEHKLRNSDGIVYNNDYFKSIDGGQSYQTFRAAYPVYPEVSFVRSTNHVFDPNDDNVLYFGTSGKGIWKMTFHGQASIYTNSYYPMITTKE